MLRKFHMLIVLMLLLAISGTAMALEAGDKIMFGTYPQSADGTAEPLEWLVLEVDSQTALIITDKIIDGMDYSAKSPCWWESSDLRAWMNKDFVDTAFTSSERDALVRFSVSDLDGSGNSTTTTDLFFALSNDQLEKYFKTDTDRKADATAYARSKGIHYDAEQKAGWWWGRSQSDMYSLFKDVFTHIETDGSVYVRGASASRKGKDNIGVRPAGLVSLSALTGETGDEAESDESEQAEPAEQTESELSEPSETEAASTGQTLKDGVNPAQVLGYGAGRMMASGYMPDMNALMDIEGIAAQQMTGSITLDGDPFVLTVDCPNDPERAEAITLAAKHVDEEITTAWLKVFSGLITQYTDLDETAAMEVLQSLSDDTASMQDGRTVERSGYDFIMKLDLTQEAPFIFSVSLHGTNPGQSESSSAYKAAAPIAFRGVSFGSTSGTFLAQMEKDGLTGSMKDTEPGSWEVYFKEGELLSETKLKNGGFLYTVNNIPDDFTVAGFKISNISATFLKAFDDNAVYEEAEKATLLKASYTFQVVDLDASYTVLRDKLTGLYGAGEEKTDSTHWTSTGGNYSESVTYTTWYGPGNTGVYLVAHREIYDDGNRPKQQSLQLCYGASNSIDQIEALRSAMTREELKKSADDVDGL